ncbi:MAG: UDP-N-acetylglucosamine 1-carboxyvinyltransferase [Clostridia bacterium]|nr:UDP-N-acetylglucosamine 1-carboxyvinyltransferase [Clostridia bacterium]
MSCYIIEGGRKLQGEVTVSGSKNASLPIIAATILNKGITKLYNVPNIHDTQITLEILKYLGCKVKKHRNKIEINSKNITKKEIPEHLMNQMRSTVILAGAILGRFKEATFSYPGGCDIGARPIDLHLSAFKKLGINISENSGFITCKCDKIIGSNIDLDFPSVGATENIILASVFAEGTTQITNAAMEPEIVDLVKCLNKMGAKIEGAGTNIITIKGVQQLKDIGYSIMQDRIEAGTLLCAAAITEGNITLNYRTPEHITPILNKLEEAGCQVSVQKGKVLLSAPRRLKAVDIKTMPYPGFPTDMQSVLASSLTVAKGTSMIIENIFENRYRYVPELKKMGAKITIEGKTAVIKGVKKLSGAKVKSTDLRGGASLVLAGLAARGTTTVTNIEYILRGYENLEQKLTELGAKIIKKEGD